MIVLDVQERRALKWYDRKRIKSGHAVPLNQFNAKGQRIYRHYIHTAARDQHMDCSFEDFAAVWAGSY